MKKLFLFSLFCWGLGFPEANALVLSNDAAKALYISKFVSEFNGPGVTAPRKVICVYASIEVFDTLLRSSNNAYDVVALKDKEVNESCNMTYVSKEFESNMPAVKNAQDVHGGIVIVDHEKLLEHGADISFICYNNDKEKIIEKTQAELTDTPEAKRAWEEDRLIRAAKHLPPVSYEEFIRPKAVETKDGNGGNISTAVSQCMFVRFKLNAQTLVKKNITVSKQMATLSVD